jgi:hypothetical protein
MFVLFIDDDMNDSPVNLDRMENLRQPVAAQRRNRKLTA